MASTAETSGRQSDLETLFGRRGWLSEHPAVFRAAMIGIGVPVELRPGTAVFREGDSANGLYGIVAGAIGVEGGHQRQTPMLGHVFRTGEWFGIKAPLHGGRRELTYRVLEPARLLFLPNTRLLPLMHDDADIAIRVGQLAEFGNRIGNWVVRDLLTADAGRRLAAVLVRVLGGGDVIPGDRGGFWLTHQQMGEMSNLSRHHVGRKLAIFEKRGWIRCGYNRIQLLDVEGLADFAYGDEGA
jgi:CRP-like cAMP-binding protein